MGKAIVLCALVISTVPFRGACETAILGTEPGDLRLSNDDIGVILWGPTASPTLSVGKSDIWDRREAKSEKPVLTLKSMIDMANAGDSAILDGAAYYTGYNSYDFPCPKTAGQIILQIPFIEPGGNVAIEKNSRDLRLRASNGQKSLDLRIFVSAVRNVIVLDGVGENLASGDVALRVFRHRDTIVPGGELHPTISGKNSPQDFERLPMPRAGHNGDRIWIAQDYPADKTFPAGFTSVLMLQAGPLLEARTDEGKKDLGTPLRTAEEGRLSHGVTKRYTPINEAEGSAATGVLGALDGPFDFFATVATSQDESDPVAFAMRTLEGAAKTGVEALWAEHSKQLDDYDARPHARAWSADGATKIDTLWGGVPYRVRPDGYYGDVPLCSVDSTKFCFQDSSMWHADFHFNEIDATGPCIQRQFDMLDSYFKMIGGLLPMAQANARDVYECAGAVYPLVHYPLRAERVVHVHATWEQSMEITALLAKPFWLRYRYTGDENFLRERAYPVLREGARFYADFLKRGDDGLYHVFPTVSPEHRGLTKNLQFNKDSQSGITLIRYHLRAAAEAASLLSQDSDEAPRWRDIAEHMPPYPTVDTTDGSIFIDVAGAQPIEYNIPVPLSAVFWGDDIGLDSPPEQVALAKRTLEKINVWEPHRGYLGRVRARLGIPEPDGKPGLENFLQSHTGVIRVFPAVSNDFAGGFENLGAQGAFVVGAEREAAGVKFITVKSLAGKECRLANPWLSDAGVTDETSGNAVAMQREGLVVRFPTQRDHTYRLAASR